MKEININELIGKTYRKVKEIEQLKNYVEQEGVLIDGYSKNKHTFLKISDGVNNFILYNILLESGMYKIEAGLSLGKVEKSDLVIMQGCRLDKKQDGYIVAVVKPDFTKPINTNIKIAWKIDEHTQKFKVISTKRVDCISEEYYNN